MFLTQVATSNIAFLSLRLSTRVPHTDYETWPRLPLRNSSLTPPSNVAHSPQSDDYQCSPLSTGAKRDLCGPAANWKRSHHWKRSDEDYNQSHQI